MKWISVMEKLPPIERDEYDFVTNYVLAATKKRNVICVSPCDFYSNEEHLKGIFTHWMPMPDAPTVEKVNI